MSSEVSTIISTGRTVELPYKVGSFEKGEPVVVTDVLRSGGSRGQRWFGTMVEATVVRTGETVKFMQDRCGAKLTLVG